MTEVFGASTKDDILQAYISDDNFRTSNVRADDVGYNLYVFDISAKFYSFSKDWSSNLTESFLIDVNGYALVLTNKLSISSDGQRHFDLI